MEKTLSDIRFGILIISDRSSRGEREDLCGPALARAIESNGWSVWKVEIVPDERVQIADRLKVWSDCGEVDVILTSGGTGFAKRDVTPEATLEVVERLAPGIAEAIRDASIQITPHGMLSRGVAGLRKQTLIVNLPGSPKGALESLDVVRLVIPHAVQLLREDVQAEQGHRYSGER